MSPARQARLDAWRGLPAQDDKQPLDRMRWVVLDVESSGLNPHRDRLLSIGAVAVHGDRLRFGDGFSVVLRQDEASDAQNILVHGIGGERQISGVPADEGLLRFLEYVGTSCLVAFHAEFDRTLIARDLDRVLGVRLSKRWLDLAELVPALVDDEEGRLRSLDDWSARFGIQNAARHEAVADAMATAELLLVALGIARARGLKSADAMFDLARAWRWRREAGR